MSTNKEQISQISKKLSKEVLENAAPSPEVCHDFLAGLQSLKITTSLLEETLIAKILNKICKSFKRHKRTAADEATEKEWEKLIAVSEKMVRSWKNLVDEDSQEKHAAKGETGGGGMNSEEGPPSTVAEYRARLVRQKKELFKDPPVLPPGPIIVEESYVSKPPKREKATGFLTFAAEDEDVCRLLKEFHPNRTPEEVLRAGAFGGTYFRPIESAVTNLKYKAQQVLKETVEDEWIRELSVDQLCSTKYQEETNKYGVTCGGSLGMWESSGWITHIDPYGWFQWYCRFYRGRRCSDDVRQISRWLKSAGPKGRFRSQLCNKVLAAKTTFDNPSVSPVIRQTLLHWGLELTQQVLDAHRQRTGR